MSGSHAEWSEDQVNQLRELWESGLSSAKIGQKLGMSKNAIVGKARRLSLSSRPSPIGASGSTSLPAEWPPASPIMHPRQPAAGDASPPKVVRQHTPRPSRPVPPVVVFGPVRQCTWLEGERQPYRRCDAPTVPGKSWCPEHDARVFWRPGNSGFQPYAWLK